MSMRISGTGIDNRIADRSNRSIRYLKITGQERDNVSFFFTRKYFRLFVFLRSVCGREYKSHSMKDCRYLKLFDQWSNCWPHCRAWNLDLYRTLSSFFLEIFPHHAAETSVVENRAISRISENFLSLDWVSHSLEDWSLSLKIALHLIESWTLQV